MSTEGAARGLDINPPKILPSKLSSITSQPQNFEIFFILPNPTS